MATITTGNGSLLLYANLNSAALHRRNIHHRQPIAFLSPPNSAAISIPPLKISLKQPLKTYSIKPQNSKFLTFSSLNPNIPQIPPQNPQFLSNLTKTLTTLFSLSLSLPSKIPQIINTLFLNLKTLFLTPSPKLLETLQFIHDNVVCAVGPLFFTSVQGVRSGPPLTAIAAGIAKWLDIYSGVLMVRILLSWFPNMPWDRQPFSAIRDLTDPFLSLCRKIVPPVSNIDLSPLLAFAVLGTLGSILGNAKA
ncbi:ylmG homolog protein 1-2, chloroplastic-like [Chenopodium quinoa]|uniref:Uncharacterized protein n=1 Tax=Chenopodium quinoa TaxID=63459 RepID=A0A803L8E3_CHEQI|nr:ylmG homolog protein 1-2, chloroplastic-like [Chenopodium quinoa]XP_021733527.1 ylmG homolog protein 1-2, chloroplastic-like [Chenopodium quinoa]